MWSRNNSSVLALAVSFALVTLMGIDLFTSEYERRAANRKLEADIAALKVRVHDRLHQRD